MSGALASAAYNLASLRAALKPFRLHFFPRVGSTNDHAAKLRRRGELFAPAVVLAGRQIKGRGRGSNTWWSPPGNLAATYVLPIEQHLQPHQLPLVAGLIVRNVVARLSSIDDIQLKWPNDLLYADRKLAGLLCERIEKADLIGVGLNANFTERDAPKFLRQRIVSLQMILGRPIDRGEIIVEIARELRRVLSHPDELPFAQLLKEYDRHHALVGRRVRVIGGNLETEIKGTCAGLDSMGRLLVRNGQTSARIIAGHVLLDS